MELEAVNVDARRLAIQIIATLVNHKKICATKILAPAGVPQDIVTRFLSERNTITGSKLSKMESAVVILDELGRTPGKEPDIIRNLIKLASRWEEFELAINEYDARGVVQKAREFEGLLLHLDQQERSELEAKRLESAARERRELAAHTPTKSASSRSV